MIVSVFGNDEFYDRYPKIRKEDIGSDTSHMFIDSCNVSNLYLEGMKGDYDGDTITARGVFTKEANEEIEVIMNKNYNFIDTSGRGIRKSSNEAIQAMYNLTMVLPDDVGKLTKPKFGTPKKKVS